MKYYKYYINILFLVGFTMCSSFINNQLISNEKYITGEDGVIRMYINILGHVESPGLYLVYDGIDIMSALSIAGGYKNGANLKNIIIYRQDGSKDEVNLSSILDNSIDVDFNPHDTIYINQRLVSKIFNSSNIPTIFLSILNLALTIDRTD
tara:strand:+ start:1662 stop:2114 length:453 start_codon:yes stop_codon:yes gene_type:complete